MGPSYLAVNGDLTYQWTTTGPGNGISPIIGTFEITSGLVTDMPSDTTGAITDPTYSIPSMIPGFPQDTFSVGFTQFDIKLTLQVDAAGDVSALAGSMMISGSSADPKFAGPNPITFDSSALGPSPNFDEDFANVGFAALFMNQAGNYYSVADSPTLLLQVFPQVLLPTGLQLYSQGPFTESDPGIGLKADILPESVPLPRSLEIGLVGMVALAALGTLSKIKLASPKLA